MKSPRENKIISYSPFANSCGVLMLVENPYGEKYLEMADSDGTDLFGPITEEQERAFWTLCKVKGANLNHENRAGNKRNNCKS